MTTWTAGAARSEIIRRARTLGFDACGFASLAEAWPASGRLADFIAAGRHGTMHWLASTAKRRGHPNGLWDEARTAVVLGMNYGPDDDPLEVLQQRTAAAISVYAQGRDYHAVIKGRLKELAGLIKARLGGEVKVFVDTAPLMEKPLAERAGLGWQGKHTNLVSRAYGSWLFLGSILTSLDLPPDTAETDHCGACRACLDVCPTGAFPAPYQLDARRCISYLTIEHAGPVDPALRPALGNRIYGCDDCLAVCPWNKFAQVGREQKLAARAALKAPSLADLAALDEAAFNALFSASPVKRIGRERLVRNVLYAMGNSGELALAEAARPLLGDADPVVKDAAAWALARLVPGER
jgi:epoxyqueuosine reductase